MNKLVEALEFYAEEKNYWEILKDHIFRTTAIAEDRGKRARDALSEHRAEPSADVVERVANSIRPYIAYPCSDDGWQNKIDFEKRVKFAATEAIAAMQKGE